MLLYILCGLITALVAIQKFRSKHHINPKPWTAGVIFIVFTWPAFVLPPCWEWSVYQFKLKLG